MANVAVLQKKIKNTRVSKTSNKLENLFSIITYNYLWRLIQYKEINLYFLLLSSHRSKPFD
jgi:hypothetical protein